ncbi:MAG: DUF2828 family protein [Bacilli bacterium]|nr:DUF2828 family protein [Bacilli bacterium]
MNLLDGMKKNNTIINTKGSVYYATTYNNNLDVFTMLTRYNSEKDIIALYEKALKENEEIALANLLYILDIRSGKGERRLFKIIYKYLCLNYPKHALRVLPFISELGRYDYILIGINTPIEKETIKLIKKQLEMDINEETPSLLAKWLPSHRTHNKNNKIAKKLIKELNMSEKEYRKTLSNIRTKLNIIEKNLTNKEYNNIDFSKIPAKAMIKYNEAYNRNMLEEYTKYKESVTKGEKKINTTGLFAYEIINKIITNKDCDSELYDLMWKNQKDIIPNNSKNLLVVADTSGSMTFHKAIPYCTSIGLAIYIAERNKGFFKNHFITFSEKPTLHEIKGNTILDKVNSMETINAWNTDIDKVFELILKTATDNNLSQKELPEQILIISDMEFDKGVNSSTGTNFDNWKKSFKEAGYQLPTIIFWNAAGSTRGIPVTKFENDVAMVSGFSTNILNNLLDLKNYSPIDVMIEKLSLYLEMLKFDK